MENIRLLEKGGTADIYDIGEGKVFKKFHDDKRDCSIENEYICTTKVQKLGLGAPKLFERVNDERGRGFIMEYIMGKNMLNLILEEKNNMEFYISEWAKIHYKINSIHGMDLPSGHEIFQWRISNSKAIKNETVREALLKLLSTLPKNDCLCHTDFHPGNIIVTDTGYRIIDWCDTMSSSIWMDVSRVMILCEETYVPDGFDVEAVSSFRRLAKELYLREYVKLAGESKEELESWMAIFAAVRLDTEIDMDIAVLENIIERTL